MTRTFQGHCHCGAVKVEHSSAIAPGTTVVRECQCSFCRLHGVRAISDPDGTVRFTELQSGTLQRYRFGLRTADFLICSQCGAYLGCVLTEGGNAVGIVNIVTLDDKALFTSPPIAAVYDDESESQRIARRKANWTPAVVQTK